jgi:hypothetical protein
LPFVLCVLHLNRTYSSRGSSSYGSYNWLLTVCGMLQVRTEGNCPFVLQAVIHDSRTRSQASRYIQANLFSQLQRMAKTCPGVASAVSPLYCCLLKLSHSFGKAYPEETQSSLLQTDCSMALLCINTGRLYTLCFGTSPHLAHVCSELGHAAEPVSVRERLVGRATIVEATYDGFQGQHHVVLGSPGLWCVEPT